MKNDRDMVRFLAYIVGSTVLALSVATALAASCVVVITAYVFNVIWRPL